MIPTFPTLRTKALPFQQTSTTHHWTDYGHSMTSKDISDNDLKRTSPLPKAANEHAGQQDELLLIIASLMEGGLEDEKACKTLNKLTRMLSGDDVGSVSSGGSATSVATALVTMIDMDALETILGYLDMRQASTVRGHATLTASAYLKAAQERGVILLADFFTLRVTRGEYDDLIFAFSVAASIFPIVPASAADIFLSEGFVPSIGPLLKRKWKDNKVETAALEMMNAACMNGACRDAILKHCVEWLEEIVENPSTRPAEVSSPKREVAQEDGPLQRQADGDARNLAAVILAKLQVITLFSHIYPAPSLC